MRIKSIKKNNRVNAIILIANFTYLWKYYYYYYYYYVIHKTDGIYNFYINYKNIYYHKHTISN